MDLQTKVKAIPYWYHRIELPGGIVTPGWAPICAEKYAIPDDLTGKRVLDIGAWDGHWTWEALKRGAAEVVAIDDFSDTLGTDVKRNGWEAFDLCREAFGFNEEMGPRPWESGWVNTEKGGRVRRLQLSVYDLSSIDLGRFDVVFFFGTIYHLKHPLLALEKIAAVCDGELYIESAVCDDYSPYHGGLEGGYRNHDMIAEFYPGAEYGLNPGNWWVPTAQCLAYMVQAAGFSNVEVWRLTENPNGPMQCRGFVWGGRTEAVPANVAQWTQTAEIARKAPKVAAVMSVPRLGFNDHTNHATQALAALRIPLRHMYGVWWGQHLERGLQMEIDKGAEVLVTLDYDTLFQTADLQELLALLAEHPEADALVPVEMKRGAAGPLATMRTITGQRWTEVPWEVFKPDLAPIATGHFGLTVFRASALLKMPHPWFVAEPDRDGQWGEGRIDEDIHFWHAFTAAGNQAFLANRVVIGHLELMALWPDDKMRPLYQAPGDFHDKGKPANCWK